ncbi:hypothetical protein GGS23DRAFT_598461 [Durotheca rogersii]|uniref:uncharacterized protein n=1 Tax=Durotheca rogersii TaxID=419775 RepID=UPI0022207CCF|nr:uncharacterized protein GGS23DRAFT_598461 [Durotheca rogersii]KAI5861294.1 hypothetical protein GGS23DRAFT_598461 [Durotheca rogersii]
MDGRIPKTPHHLSHANPSNTLQEKPPDAATDKDTELQSRREQLTVDAQDATSVQTAKRQLDATSESDLLPSKRARLTQTDAQFPGVAGKAEKTDKTTLQQPRPQPPRRPYASFLRDSVDPVHPESVDTFVSEWLESVGSERKEHCRSDSQLHRLDSPVSRQLARSAPEMGSRRDADKFVIPPTPGSSGSRSNAATESVAPSGASSRSYSRSLVEDQLYRDVNLPANNIYMRSSREQFPEHIATLIDDVRRDRTSPGPSREEVWEDTALERLSLGASEPQVENYFRREIFPDPGPSDPLERADRLPMSRHAVPNTGSQLKVSNPVPDMLYGYNLHNAFPQQQGQLASMGSEMVANSQNLIYPFFVIEFKGDGPSGGGTIWVATNQCLGGSSSCVNIAERLNRQLKQCKSSEVSTINSAAFSIAIRGTEARLHISWKHDDLRYYMANVKSFLLQEPDDYIQFRKYVRNIIDWGKDKRLKEIRASLDTLLEESRRRTSEEAKSRPPPSESSASSSKRGKSSSRGQTSGAGSHRSPSSGADDYWTWDDRYNRWYHMHSDGSVTWDDGGQSSSRRP